MEFFRFRTRAAAFNPFGAVIGFADRLREVPVWRPRVKEPKRREKREPKPILKFMWALPGRGGGFVRARSRCDARSLVKHELGIAIKRRLPVDVVLECVG